MNRSEHASTFPDTQTAGEGRIALRIAGIPFSVAGAAATRALRALGGFPPFVQTGLKDTEPLFTFETSDAPAPRTGDLAPLHRFLTEGIDCTFSRTAEDGYAFSMDRGDGSRPFRWVFRPAEKKIVATGDVDPTVLRFSLWLAFGTVALARRTVAVHSSVVCAEGKAVLFLGESGTGKSTHTRLWMEHIEGASLLNDDSPFLQAAPEGILAWGSPWSGKTPCYHDLSFPVAAIVRLSQAPHNRIRRLSTVEAVGALLPSFPPSFAYDAALKDTMLELLSQTLRTVPVYHLECLPDAAAARLSHRTVFEGTAL